MTEMQKFDAEALQKVLTDAQIIFTWSTRRFGICGVNPYKFNMYIYIFVISYSCMHLLLNCLALPQNMNDGSSMMDALTEFVSFISVLVKLTLYGVKRKNLVTLINDMEPDYSIDKYKNEAEVRLFVKYMEISKLFYNVVMPLSYVTSICYYIRFFAVGGFGIPIKLDEANVTVYQLPYRVTFYVPVTDFKTYICAMVYLLPVIPITAFTLVTDTALMIAMLAHVCGQLSVLSRSILVHCADDVDAFRRTMTKAVVEHCRLIRLAKTIDGTYNLVMLQQVLCVMFFLCFVSYSLLMHWSQRESSLILTFVTSSVGESFLLFGFCYAGQCLIDESTHVADALIQSTWYKVEPMYQRYFIIFLCRSRNPLLFTGGGFFLYSLNSFVVVMKSIVAYVSVLRTLI